MALGLPKKQFSGIRCYSSSRIIVQGPQKLKLDLRGSWSFLLIDSLHRIIVQDHDSPITVTQKQKHLEAVCSWTFPLPFSQCYASYS